MVSEVRTAFSLGKADADRVARGLLGHGNILFPGLGPGSLGVLTL